MPESNSVGYKHPPATGQFKKGTSGNPKGRRKGSPNVANLTKAALNQPVTVREGGKTRVMPAAEAIIRSLVAKGEARTIYLQCRGKKVSGGRSAENLVLEDFVVMRNAELTCPLMEEIEELFAPTTNAPMNV